MFQLVNLIFSSRESVVKFASVIVVALGFSWFSLLLYSITVIYNINFALSFLSCVCLHSLGFTMGCSCSSLPYYHAEFFSFWCASSVHGRKLYTRLCFSGAKQTAREHVVCFYVR